MPIKVKRITEKGNIRNITTPNFYKRLKKAQNIIESGNGKIDAIILNEHDTDKSPLNQLLA